MISVPAPRHRIGGVPFATRLADHGDRLALITPDGDLTYRELADRVARRGEQLGAGRRLVLLAADNSLPSLVTYLACLAHGHPVVVTPGADERSTQQISSTYAPDVVSVHGALPTMNPGSHHEPLHPDLALLLSTSGTTGSPKLVRLSAANLQANAESIVSFLQIRDTDRAITTLPMSYCYGLSVIHSHLQAGAALVLTDRSVIDPGFWELFARAGATSFAAVPYTFDLLDQIGFAQLHLPRLRYVTQAGGAMDPAQVRSYAELGRRHGWDLFVMYGQTEATARMAYLPPDLAIAHPASVGRPVPGGTLRIEPVPEHPEHPQVGELVYAGPNVMLGYAHGPEDLARGDEGAELRTGDLARLGADGLIEVVGRLGRCAKVAGLRIDLDRLESHLLDRGHAVHCAASATGPGLGVAVTAGSDTRGVARLLAEETGLPTSAVRVRAPVPRLANGKPDHLAIAQFPPDPSPARPDDLLALYAGILDRDDVDPRDTFVDLGGDSLSFVELSLRLESALGHLPPAWAHTPIGELARVRRATTRSWWHRIDANVALRAIAIVLIVGSHSNVFTILGGAHVLIAAAGYNVARFHLTDADRVTRVRRLLTGAARVAVPSITWIALIAALTGSYTLTTVLLLNGVAGPPTWTTQSQFWFIEVVLLLVLLLAAAVSIPAVHRLEQRAPFRCALGVVALGLLTRYDVVLGGDPDRIHAWQVLLWLFALGWAAAKAPTRAARLLVSVLVVATVPGFFGDPAREAVVVVGVLVMTWATTVPWPAVLARPAGLLASSSLFIYLTHWQVYPHLEDDYPVLGLVASVVVGVMAWRVSLFCEARLRLLGSACSTLVARSGRTRGPGPPQPGMPLT